MLSRAQLKLYTEAHKPSANGDARHGADHNRRHRSFVRVQYGPYEIKFYPIKEWPQNVGVTNQTLRTWLKRRVITAYTMHHMYVMCKAEQVALAEIVRKHRLNQLRHTEISQEMRQDCIQALTKVRTALDTLRYPNLDFTEEHRMLLQPSIGDK